MKNTGLIRLGDAKGIFIQVDGNSADDVATGFVAALRQADEAMQRGERIDQTHIYKHAKVRLIVEPKPSNQERDPKRSAVRTRSRTRKAAESVSSTRRQRVDRKQNAVDHVYGARS